MKRTALVAFFTLTMVALPAAAQNKNDAAAAEALFKDGKRLMQENQYAAACPKFAESQRLDPGIGTMLWLGECQSKNGQIASAWAIFHEAEALAAKTKDPRVSVARDEAAKLEPRISKLTLDVSPAASSTQGLEIKRDGVVLGKPLWGTPIPTDGGSHTITASAPSKKSWSTTIAVPKESGAISVKIPSLEDAPAEQPVAPSKSQDEDPHRGSTQRILGLVIGGVGLVGIGAGSYFGIATGSKNDESKDKCRPDNPNLCSQEGLDLRDDAKMFGTISTISFIAGGALLVGGVVLFFTAPKSKAGAKVTTGWSPSSGGFARLTF